jgi:hypothetical protein
MNRDEFQEDRAGETDPLDGQPMDFNWPALYESFGETERERDEVMAVAASALKEVLRFCVAGRANDPRFIKGAGMRVIAAAWVLDPALFENSPSLSALCRDFGFSTANLSPITAAFSKRFNFHSRAQAHYRPRHTGQTGEGENEPPTNN